MRVEQQNANIVDTLKQNIGPKEQTNTVFGADGMEVFLADKKVEKDSKSANAKSVNVKDATYLKPDAGEKKTTAEEIEQAGVLDAAERKDQMAVLANTTSPEDYAKMQEDGFSLEETTSNTIVTETDKIKAQLAKAGVDISFFGEELSLDELEAIVGSTELATQLAKALKEADVPCNEENLKDGAEAARLAGMLEKPDDGAIKYMLDNGLNPTIENLYWAEYSSSRYRDSAEVPVDMTSFMDQVETIISQAGYPVNDRMKADCAWMLENNIPLNEENLKHMETLKNIEIPVDTKTLVKRIATAVAEGKRPQDAFLDGKYELENQAERAFAVVNEATEADIAYAADRGMDMNIRSISYAMAARETEASAVNGDAAVTIRKEEMQTAYTQRGLSLLTASRQLEEIRLAMTTQANYALLRRGIEIDTEPLAKLVEELKAYENSYYEKLLKAQGVDASEENVSLFRETTEKLAGLRVVPAYVLGMQEAKNASVGAVHEAGQALQRVFEQANESYETLMTAPRADLGDSIRKAFRNVDAILTDLGLETSEANRRAVRILGYNSIAITAKSVAEMKLADEDVQRTFKNLTPQTVVELIRRGVNPLDMDFAALNETAEAIKNELGGQESSRFAEFLWKLEKNDAITEEERASYIGTYRLIHQVERSDGAVIGALVNQGAQLTMRNLMMAVRSGYQSGKVDYEVDNSFGKMESHGYGNTSIIDQIETAYQNNCVKDVAESLTPEKMRKVMQQEAGWEDLTPEQLKEALAAADVDETGIDYAYAKEQLVAFAQSAKAAEDIYAVLKKYDIPNTMANIMAMEAMAKNRNGMFRQIFGKSEAGVNGTAADELEEAKEALLEAFGEAVSAPEELAEAQEQLSRVAENVMKTMIADDEVTSLDVRQMRLLSAQLSLNGLLAREEQYAVPVQVGDGVVNVSLKIVRGEGKKGIVDIMMESGLRGKIAATFQAKEQGIHGLVAAEQAETKALLEEHGAVLAERLESEEDVQLHYAHVKDLDLNQFSMGLFGVKADTQEYAGKDEAGYRVQTVRLYQIAECFIRELREFL